jgi:hypothetical protein
MPELARLTESREKASLYVEDGEARVLLLLIPSPESVIGYSK